MKNLFQNVILIFCFILSLGIKAEVKIETSLSHPIILKDKKQTIYLKVNLEGLKGELSESKRLPVNMSLVLDKSGSMNGIKIERAKEAARMIINSLSKDDIFSFVLFAQEATTLIPATKVSNKKELIDLVDTIKADGGTALFAGISKGIIETEKFLGSQYVNRVVLLSDGQANQGPSSTEEIGQLGIAAIKQGVSITTIGIGEGYNEELMNQLALKSDGNHGYAASPEQIASLLKSELGQILNVMGKEIKIKLICAKGVRPVKVVDKESSISGGEVTIFFNQIYHEQKKYALIELEVNEKDLGNGLIAKTEINYIDGITQKNENQMTTSYVKNSDSIVMVESSINKEILASVFVIEALDRNVQAIKLAKSGDIKGSRVILGLNQISIEDQKSKYNSEQLKEVQFSCEALLQNLGKDSFQENVKDYNAVDNTVRSQNKIQK